MTFWRISTRPSPPPRSKSDRHGSSFHRRRDTEGDQLLSVPPPSLIRQPNFRCSPNVTETVQTQFCEIATREQPFRFADGGEVGPVVLAYETYGELNAARDNAILVFHALTGSQHAAGLNPELPDNRFWTRENHVGWWDAFIGPGKAFDTRKHFVICVNYIGGCYGSTGPSSIDPETGKPYGSRFPNVAVRDIVDSQVRLLDRLGIDKLLAVAGGSVGGFCVMDFAVRFPERVEIVIPIASGLRATALVKCFNIEQVFAIVEDANFRGGDYYDGEYPWRGLCLARMIGHKTFVSLETMERRARGVIIQPDDLLGEYHLQHRIESYMLHQGKKFVARFDPNSYLLTINAWQSFDLPKELANGDPVKLFRPCKKQKWLIFSISSDSCFYPSEQAEIHDALDENGIEHHYITVHSDKGHDSFLLDPPLYSPHIGFMLASVRET